MYSGKYLVLYQSISSYLMCLQTGEVVSIRVYVGTGRPERLSCINAATNPIIVTNWVILYLSRYRLCLTVGSDCQRQLLLKYTYIYL